MCPQNYPPWMASIGWVPDYIQSGVVPNATTVAAPSSNTSSTPPRDPMQNEDCLFLDVMVPEEIFEKAGRGSGAPVLVWIYGKNQTRKACVDVLTKPRPRRWLCGGFQNQRIRSKKPYPPESDEFIRRSRVRGVELPARCVWLPCRTNSSSKRHGQRRTV